MVYPMKLLSLYLSIVINIRSLIIHFFKFMPSGSSITFAIIIFSNLLIEIFKHRRITDDNFRWILYFDIMQNSIFSSSIFIISSRDIV